MHWPRDKSIFENKEKIVNSRRSKSNIFALETRQYYEQSDIMVTVIKEEFLELFPPKYVLALLNSKVYYMWLKNRGKLKGDMLEIYGKPLEEIPIIEADKSIINKIIFHVNNILNDKGNYKTEIVEIDKLIYKSLELTSEEISIVEESGK